MNRRSGSLLRVTFAFDIVSLAIAVSVAVRAIFHSDGDRITGITFPVAVVCLVIFFEKVFPSVYVRRPSPWWQGRTGEAVGGLALAIIISILSSRVATLWFGLLIVSGVLVAVLLRTSRRDGEL